MTALTSAPASFAAHGVGNRQDLPLPFPFLVVGASVALLVSFLALALLWRTPRLRPDDGLPLPGWCAAVLDSRVVRAIAVILTLTLSVVTLAALVWGTDDGNNPAPYVVFVWLWIGLAVLSMVLGPIWVVLNPLRWLHRGLVRVARISTDHPRLRYRAGYWPAAFSLFAFTWLELIAPNRTSRNVLGEAVLGFVVISVAAALLFGQTWFSQGDPFEVMSRLYGSLSVIGRRPDRTWVLRSPIHGVDRIVGHPGLLVTARSCSGGRRSTASPGRPSGTPSRRRHRSRSSPRPPGCSGSAC